MHVPAEKLLSHCPVMGSNGSTCRQPSRWPSVSAASSLGAWARSPGEASAQAAARVCASRCAASWLHRQQAELAAWHVQSSSSTQQASPEVRLQQAATGSTPQ